MPMGSRNDHVFIMKFATFFLEAPRQVANISVKNRYETELILEWKKVNNNNNYTYTLCYDGQNVSINGSGEGSAVTYKVQNLTDGSKYTFYLYTVFKKVQSTGKILITVTSKFELSSDKRKLK